MKKVLYLLLVICLFVGCTARTEEKSIPSDTTETSQLVQETSQLGQVTSQIAQVTSTEEASSSIAEENMTVEAVTEPTTEKVVDQTKGAVGLEEPKLIGSILCFSAMPDIDQEMINKVRDLNFKGPQGDVDIYYYTPKPGDVVSYQYSDESKVRLDSLRHKGFSGLEVIYEHHLYTWDEFMGDISYTEIIKEIIARLKGNSIYEEDRFDYATNYKYYLESKGVYYEVNEVLLGDLTGPKEALTKRREGMSCNYPGLEGIKKPTYNPFVMDKDEVIMNAYITMLDAKPCVYLEVKSTEKLFKKWISIQHGVLIKEEVFDHRGIQVEDKFATSLKTKAIDDSVFYEPMDIAFKDITLFIYRSEGGDVDTLWEGFDNTIPDKKTGILLSEDNGEEKRIYTGGIDSSGMKLQEAMYVTTYLKEDGTELTVRQMVADRIYTIVDDLETVEIYDESTFEEKFFNFSDMGLIGVKDTEKGKIYTFYDPNNISVSEMYDVYEYVVEDKKIVKINTYMVDSILSKEKYGEEASYRIEIVPMDENVWDNSCMNTYKIIDHGQGSVNDGEHMPFWLQSGQ